MSVKDSIYADANKVETPGLGISLVAPAQVSSEEECLASLANFYLSGPGLKEGWTDCVAQWFHVLNDGGWSLVLQNTGCNMKVINTDPGFLRDGPPPSPEGGIVSEYCKIKEPGKVKGIVKVVSQIHFKLSDGKPLFWSGSMGPAGAFYFYVDTIY